MKKIIALTVIAFSFILKSNAYAGIYIKAPNAEEAQELSGSIIGSTFQHQVSINLGNGEVTLINPLAIELLDARTQKPKGELLLDGENLADAQLLLLSSGKKLHLISITPKSSIYQGVGHYKVTK